jgi:hypothetical protein
MDPVFSMNRRFDYSAFRVVQGLIYSVRHPLWVRYRESSIMKHNSRERNDSFVQIQSLPHKPASARRKGKLLWLISCPKHLTKVAVLQTKSLLKGRSILILRYNDYKSSSYLNKVKTWPMKKIRGSEFKEMLGVTSSFEFNYLTKLANTIAMPTL